MPTTKNPPQNRPHATARRSQKPADRTKPAQTLAERLRAELAEEITSGRLEPGTGLDETVLAARFGVSRTPVREALRELAAGGLVDARAHRGAVVAAIDEVRLDQMFTVLIAMEALCAGLAAVAMTAGERAALDEMHGGDAELVQLGDFAGYAAANDRFHAFVHTASHNGFLAETVDGLRRRVAAFRRARFSDLGRLAQSHAEHDRLVQAMLRADREEATVAMREHLEGARRLAAPLRDMP
jgi:DNA-binding GntR family transcriptional regulator